MSIRTGNLNSLLLQHWQPYFSGICTGRRDATAGKSTLHYHESKMNNSENQIYMRWHHTLSSETEYNHTYCKNQITH